MLRLYTLDRLRELRLGVLDNMAFIENAVKPIDVL